MSQGHSQSKDVPLAVEFLHDDPHSRPHTYDLVTSIEGNITKYIVILI